MWLSRYFRGDWPLIPFQPILYVFIFGAALRLWISTAEPPQFDDVIISGFYPVWLALGTTGPLLSLLSWLMIRCSGRKRFMGMWLRFSADIQVLTMLVTFHLVNVANVLDKPITETKVFSRYMTGAALLFVICLVIRDVWTLVITERLAMRIHRGDCGPNGDQCE